jgi:hypothetical protein
LALESDSCESQSLIGALGAIVPETLTMAVVGFEDLQRTFNGNFRNFVVFLRRTLVSLLGILTFEWFAINRLIRERRKANRC